MSRSRKKTPIIGNAVCQSEKKDKRIANRRYRRIVNSLAKREKLEAYRHDYTNDIEYWWDNDWQDNSKNMHWVYPVMDEVANKWDMGKDGKSYLTSDDSRLKNKTLRK